MSLAEGGPGRIGTILLELFSDFTFGGTFEELLSRRFCELSSSSPSSSSSASSVAFPPVLLKSGGPLVSRSPSNCPDGMRTRLGVEMNG